MIDKEMIAANLANGYIHVGEVEQMVMWKKDNGQGGFTYYVDQGYDCGPLVCWDTTCNDADTLRILYKDVVK